MNPESSRYPALFVSHGTLPTSCARDAQLDTCRSPHCLGWHPWFGKPQKRFHRDRIAYGTEAETRDPAGALHPIKSVIIDSDGYAVAYDDDHDAFLAIKPRKLDLLANGLRSCTTVLPSAHGHVIALMADVHLTSTVYKNPESLLWRDAGAVLQTLAMVSEAFDLGFCPLGILGQDFADALLPEDHQYLGVGVAVIGQRAPE